MTLEYAQHNWALLVAGVLASVVFLIIVFRVYQDSARGQLNAQLRKLGKAEQAARDADKAIHKAGAKLERLRARSSSVKPRHIDEAAGLLADTQALKKIADDQVLIAQNHVRKIIVEEFPPKRHEAMRQKLLPAAAEDRKPFTIES